MNAPEPILTLDHVSCVYHIKKSRLHFVAYPALSDISLKLYQGEILGLVGHNGAGKSTLLRLLAGILTPSRGRVIHTPDLTLSLLSLGTGFSDMLSGRDNAVWGAMLTGNTFGEARDRVDDIIAFSELGTWIDEPVRTYSTGMRARLSFAVALQTNPDVLLIDEVLGVGDGHFQQKSSEALQQKIHHGQTAVIVSHSPEALAALCSRIIWLENGRVRMEGETSAVLPLYLQSLRETPEALSGVEAQLSVPAADVPEREEDPKVCIGIQDHAPLRTVLSRHAFPALVAALLLSSAVALYAPLCSYWGNVNEFAFNGRGLLRALLPWWTAGWLLLAGVLLGSAFRLPGEPVTARPHWRAGPGHILCLCLAALLLLEGGPLSLGLPQLNGALNMFSSPPRLIVDSLVWIAGLSLALMCWRPLARHLLPLSLALVVLMAAGLGDAALHRAEKIPTGTDRNTVLRNVRFHPENNIILILADAMDSQLFEHALEVEPSFREALQGFTYFRNNLGVGGSTGLALPGILGGIPYEGGNYRAFVYNALFGVQGIPGYFTREGYDVYLSSTLPVFNFLPMYFRGATGGSLDVTPGAMARLLFRFCPYALKSLLATPLYLQEQSGDTPSGPQRNPEDFSLLLTHLKKDNLRPTVHFHHVQATHQPFVEDALCRPVPPNMTRKGSEDAGICTIRRLAAFTEELRRNDLYDNSVVVFLADHGRHFNDTIYSPESPYFFNFPVLLVKPARSGRAFTVSDAPTTSASVAPLLRRFHRLGASENTLDDFVAHLLPIREYGGEKPQLVHGVDITGLTWTPKESAPEKSLPQRLTIGTRYTLIATDLNKKYIKLQSDYADIMGIHGIHIPKRKDGTNIYLYTKREYAEKFIDVELQCRIDNFSGSVVFHDGLKGAQYTFSVETDGVYEKTFSFILHNIAVSRVGEIQLNTRLSGTNDGGFLALQGIQLLETGRKHK